MTALVGLISEAPSGGRAHLAGWRRKRLIQPTRNGYVNCNL
ncbi:hypothetical protein HMPREF0208_01908 [Citrobacter koseri]|nr:hypothetical protein HMPREF3207_03202 [Citrobacter koseri]KXB44557.1 hypothetical protein HMPREF0208_01908 [Citrobacter koseri]